LFTLNFEKLALYDAGKVGISIDVRLELGGHSSEFTAKLDTGATACVFNRAYGEELELEIETGEIQRFSTTTGSFSAYGHYVTLNAAGFEFYPQVFFAEDEKFNRNVLGRNGWLDRVIIGINDYDGKLYLSRYESV